MLKMKPASLACVALCLSLTSTGALAQFSAVEGGVRVLGGIFGQVVNGVSSKVMAADLKDIQAERVSYFAKIEPQLAGMDPAAKRQHLAAHEQAWGLVEQNLLLQNAQAVRAKDAPLIDVSKIAMDAMGGIAQQANMAAVFGNAGIGDVLTSATMEGIITGAGGKTEGARIRTARTTVAGYGAPTVGAAVAAQATAEATNVASNTVSSAVGGFIKKMGFGSDSSKFEANESLHPLKFLGKHPSELQAKDLYRENGFQGLKRIEASAQNSAEAYAPIMGDPAIKAIVYNYDKSGAVKAAFRLLAAPPDQFNAVVDAVSAQLQEPARYASTGSIVRAVWSSGAFITSDGTKLTLGWSHLVPKTYEKAPAAVVASNTASN